MGEAVLEAQAVGKSYPLRAPRWHWRKERLQAVEEVSCVLARGERLGLVGESGCGKTTLAKLLVGLIPPSAGEVRVLGRSWQRLRGHAWRQARRAVQLIFQDPTHSVNPRMTVEEIVSEPLRIHRLARGEAARRARVEALLAGVHLPATYRTRLPRQLSGGERQRVGLARALAVDPAVLICDEPIASLDVSVGAQMLALLRQLSQQRQMALLFISHDLRAVASLCERVAVMRQGRLLEVAATEALLRRPRHPYTAHLLRCATLDLDALPSPEGEG